MTAAPLWISDRDVEALLDPQALIAATAEGFAAAENGGIREAGSTRLDGLDAADSYMTLYPAHAVGGLASAKLLAGRPANAAQGQPEIDAVVALVDPASGRIVALVAARTLTACRTAAATTAVLTRFLRRVPARIGLVGTGTQARAHGRILSAAGLAKEFVVASPRGDMGKARAVAEEIGTATGIPVRTAEASSIAVTCDAVILMTLAFRPIDLGDLGADAVIASIGPFYPHGQEMDPSIVRTAACVVSDHPARLRRQWAGSPMLDVEALPLFSAADVIAGRCVPPAAGRRVFLSDGRGFQDNVAAAMVYRAALAAGRGTPLP